MARGSFNGRGGISGPYAGILTVVIIIFIIIIIVLAVYVSHNRHAAGV